MSLHRFRTVVMARSALVATLVLPACATVGAPPVAATAAAAVTGAGDVPARTVAPPARSDTAAAASSASREGGAPRLTARRVGLVVLVIIGLTGLSLLVGG
ncbi:MAG: hypothetical protein MUF40_05825 [Gemmatimonadaceae bacterium]|jgi:hypothetical protein|nr:hypothetical protein [Gemmatimonadaceae bacterium]